ncbi:MAG: Hsp70 family protein, partial [Ferruginibacter sp.]
MELDYNGKEIIHPSLIGFYTDKTKNLPISSIAELYSYSKNIDGVLLFGDKARQAAAQSDFEIFESIKKLLGYTDTRNLPTANGNITINGSDLTYFMVDGLYNNFKKYIVENKSKANIAALCPNDKLDVKRAVITIPNNFTVKKISDLVKAIESMKQFNEIRYIYEAEAVFFYYLSNLKFKKKTAEKVLIFDMGGATINVTALDYKFEEGNHNIKILSKVGYSIGGDSIDYYLKEHLFGGTRGTQYPYITGTIRDPKNYIKTGKIARYKLLYHDGIKAIKHKMSNRWASKEEELYAKSDLDTVFTNYISRSDLSEKVKNDYHEKWKKFYNDSDNAETPIRFIDDLKRDGTSYRFRTDKEVSKVYRNLYQLVEDSIIETLIFSKVETFDKIIFSGRSSQFPYIKDTVLEAYNFK